ncbi:MAG: hypothetical protein IKM08_07785 [Clostridia bacterium]|nr:hypothetical protein [Clostridia bacterium]
MARPDNRSKLILGIVGIVLLLTGIILIVIGVADFFTIIGRMRGMPKKFWCLFVGFPVTAIGTFLTLLGFRRDIGSAAMEQALLDEADAQNGQSSDEAQDEPPTES